MFKCVIAPAPTNCPASKFQCESGHCITMAWKCDNEDDCNDGIDGQPSSDERDCSKFIFL